MYMILAILLVIMVTLIVLSFFLKTRGKIFLCTMGYLGSFVCMCSVILRNVSVMSLEIVREINHKVGLVAYGGLIIAVVCILTAKVIKDKIEGSVKVIVFNSLAILGIIMFCAGNFCAMSTYVELDQRDIPVVNLKENVIVSTDTEYRISDFIDVENSHGEEFTKIVWAKGSYEDTTDIVISDDKKSFSIADSHGNLKIQILVHHSHYSDSETKVIYVSVDEK